MLAGRNFNVNQLLNWQDEGSRSIIYLKAIINYSIRQIPCILSNTFIKMGFKIKHEAIFETEY
jgi:hypothetical protein